MLDHIMGRRPGNRYQHWPARNPSEAEQKKRPRFWRGLPAILELSYSGIPGATGVC
jgi:hypothetical protein